MTRGRGVQNSQKDLTSKGWPLLSFLLSTRKKTDFFLGILLTGTAVEGERRANDSGNR